VVARAQRCPNASTRALQSSGRQPAVWQTGTETVKVTTTVIQLASTCSQEAVLKRGSRIVKVACAVKHKDSSLPLLRRGILSNSSPSYITLLFDHLTTPGTVLLHFAVHKGCSGIYPQDGDLTLLSVFRQHGDSQQRTA
jgi:hypothetical protein